ncbi:hypothetical protein D3C79_758030 [compost metagenome]
MYGVVAVAQRRARGVEGGVACLIMPGAIAAARQLPDVAARVEQAKAIGHEAAHRGGAGETVERLIVIRELALPGIGHGVAVGPLSRAPTEVRILQATAHRVFQLRLAGQCAPGPAGVGLGIAQGHLHHRVVGPIVPVAAGPQGVAPVRPGNELPAGPQHLRALLEHHCAWHPQRVWQVGGGLCVDALFGLGHVAGGLYEAGELGIGDRVHVDPEGRDLGPVRRAFFAVEAV